MKPDPSGRVRPQAAPTLLSRNISSINAYTSFGRNLTSASVAKMNFRSSSDETDNKQKCNGNHDSVRDES